jgi:hypothetical protein
LKTGNSAGQNNARHRGFPSFENSAFLPHPNLAGSLTAPINRYGYKNSRAGQQKIFKVNAGK